LFSPLCSLFLWIPTFFDYVGKPPQIAAALLTSSSQIQTLLHIRALGSSLQRWSFLCRSRMHLVCRFLMGSPKISGFSPFPFFLFVHLYYSPPVKRRVVPVSRTSLSFPKSAFVRLRFQTENFSPRPCLCRRLCNFLFHPPLTRAKGFNLDGAADFSPSFHDQWWPLIPPFSFFRSGSH